LIFLSLPAAAAERPAITNITILPNKQIQLDLVLEQGQSYIFEVSTDLTNWMEVGGLANVTTNRITVVDEDTTDRSSMRFYRMKIGRFQSFIFGLMHFARGGQFAGQALTPAVSYPLAYSDYSARFQAEGDAPYPAPADITFTGPVGSGLNATPANPDNSSFDDEGAWYQSPTLSTSSGAPAGTWTVNYRGTNITFSTDLIPLTRLVVPVPTVTLAGGTLQSVSWIYRDRSTGQSLSGAPSYVQSIQVQMEGFNGRIYESPYNLDPAQTTHTLTSPVTWSDVNTINMAYDDAQGNHYVLFFTRSMPPN
jgi:hypothetical protein